MLRLSELPDYQNQCLTLTEDGILNLVKKIKLADCKPDDHIPLIEKEIEWQLQFIKPHLVSNEQLKLYNNFFDEFNQRKLSKQVSYRWWIIFAYRLSILVTRESQRTQSNIDLKIVNPFVEYIIANNSWHTYDDFVRVMREGDPSRDPIAFAIYAIYALLDQFPEVVMIPTTLSDKSISLFNNCLKLKSIPLSISTKMIITDGQSWHPDRFFRHDLVHAENWFYGGFKGCREETVQLFVENILESIYIEPNIRKKSQLEFMLFIITHEYLFLFMRFNCDNFKQIIIDPGNVDGNFYHKCENDTWYFSLIKPYLDLNVNPHNQIIDYVNEGIDNLIEYISKFFSTYQIYSFTKEATKERNYKIKAALTEDEINDHWTTNNQQAKAFLVKRYGSEYQSSLFYNYLVKKDKNGPDPELLKKPSGTLTYLMIKERREFTRKVDKSCYAKMFHKTKKQEVIKNSRILAQAYRSDESNLFTTLPQEILIRIAQLTATDINEEEAKHLAIRNFNKPLYR